MTRNEIARYVGQNGRIEPITEGNGDEMALYEPLLERFADREYTPIRDRWHEENRIWRR